MTISNTGLPELPEGHVWHITPSKSGTRLWVSLVRGEDLVWSEFAWPDHESVRQAAEWCLYHYEDNREKRKQVEAFCGIYPPKRLEATL